MQISIYLHGFLSIILLLSWQVPTFAAPKHYIIHLGSHHAEPRLSANPETITNSHHELISSVLPSDFNPSERIVYSYNKIINAFAANLHEEEANELAKHPSVASITESRTLKLLTTHSVDFLGFPNKSNNGSNIDESIWIKASFGDDIIIANMDTGVWPESASFLDQGFGPVPTKFKGVCANENDPTFKCNRKLIGARYFYKGNMEEGKLSNYTFNDTLSPRDHNAGHGTHTLSTAGGNIVPGVSISGFANGTAKGAAPRARLVAYKNAWHPSDTYPIQLSSMDILAAFEAAIDDNVDIINASIGDDDTNDYLSSDAVAIGSFHAMKNGILTVASAGNTGPNPGTIKNVAPWLFTIAASTIDREFSAFITFGNNQTIKGTRYLDPMTTDPNKLYPLMTGGEARNAAASVYDGMACRTATLDPAKVKGKIVICYNSNVEDEPFNEVKESMEAKNAEAAGLILVNDKNNMGFGPSKPHCCPTVVISSVDGDTLFSYINSTRSPTVSMSNGTTILGVKPSPVMASFSSRGPANAIPNILKPDVTAPGVNIIAAYPATVDPNNVTYNIQHGTSMSAPHVAGVVALLKKVHPDWSIAAIKSAIMTTASPLDNRGLTISDNDWESEATPFAFGSGHVTPNKAMDPGLVYELNQYDYLNFICSATHENDTTLKIYNKNQTYKCPPSYNILDFNYPSIIVPYFTGNAIATRKLKNVGPPGTYTPRIEAPKGVSIVVEPKTLVFSTEDQELSFKLTFTADIKVLPEEEYIFGSLVWSDAKHVVRSPIAIKAN